MEKLGKSQGILRWMISGNPDVKCGYCMIVSVGTLGCSNFTLICFLVLGHLIIHVHVFNLFNFPFALTEKLFQVSQNLGTFIQYVLQSVQKCLKQ